MSFKRFSFRVLSCLLIALFVGQFPVAAKAQEKKKTKSKQIVEGLTDSEFLKTIGILFAALGATQSLRVYKEKERYDSVLPIFKLEGNYQKTLTDIQGFHGGVELGMAFIGGDVEYTRLMEDNPSNTTNIFSTHFLYRMALIKEAQLNIALGYKKFSGGVNNDSLDLGAPLYLFPSKRWTIEAKPFFSFINNTDKVVYDMQGGLRYKYNLIGIRGGYRFIRIQQNDWHGPEVGLAFEW